MSFLKWKNS